MVQKGYLFLFILFISCNQSSKKLDDSYNRFAGFEEIIKEDLSYLSIKDVPITTINIGANTEGLLNLEELIDSVHYVKLQTTRNSLIGKIDKIFVLPKFIIIVDKQISQSILVFNREGEFLNQIGRLGKAQHEYRRIRDVAFNYKTNEILLYDDFSTKILYFNIDGELNRSEKIFFQASHLAILPDQTYVYELEKNLNEHIPEISRFNIIIGDSKNIQSKALEINEKYYEFKLGTITNFHPSKNSILYSSNFGDTIYDISNKNNIVAKYYINTGNKNINKHLKPNTSSDAFLKLLKSGDYYYFQGLCAETPKSLYFELLNKNTLGYFYMKKSGKLIGGVKSYKSRSDSKIKYFAYPITSFGNSFVGVIQSSHIHMSKLSKNKPNTGEDIFAFMKPEDNPVLIFYTLK